MRYPASFRRLTALLPVVLLSAGMASAQTPNLAGTVGTGTNTFYFALDFRDFTAPQFYSFAVKSNATTLKFDTLLSQLTTLPGFTTRISDGGSFGLSLDGIGYAGKEKYNNFAGLDSGEPFGYWGQYNSQNGTAWNFNDFGISQQPSISAGQYFGASWVHDYRTDNGAAPRVTFATSAPEPGTCALLLSGGLMGVAVVRRRRPVK